MKCFVCAGVVIAILAPLMTHASELIRLFPGYITKVRCGGRLLVSAVGNDGLVRLEALPKEIGCGVLLKPLAAQGKTNFILETTAGTFLRELEIMPGSGASTGRQFEIYMKGETP